MSRCIVVASLAALLLVAPACAGSDAASDPDPDPDTGDAGDASDAGPGDDAALSGASGLITVDGVEYPYEATTCFDVFGDLLADGFGETADGTVYLAGVSYSLNVRNGDLVPPEMSADELAAAITAGDIQEDVSVLLELGRDELLTPAPEDQPSFRAERVFGNDIEGSIDTWAFVDGVLTGSGQVIDQHGVALPEGSTAPVEFIARCE